MVFNNILLYNYFMGYLGKHSLWAIVVKGCQGSLHFSKLTILTLTQNQWFLLCATQIILKR